MEEVKLAARAGDIDAFYRVLEIEPSILKDIDEKQFVETPLHTAASSGCTDFAIEMLSLMTSFGRKLDPRGYSPLDLALRSGHRDTVKQLIEFDPELIQVRSRERKTPLHYVAEIDDADLLSEFLVACPTAIKELTIRKETVVHLAVINRNIQAFKVLIGWLDRTDNKEILDWKDKNGSTVLHIAAQTSQVEILKILTEEKVDLNVTNQQNKTALDIVADQTVDHSGAGFVSAIGAVLNHEILHRAGAMKTSELPKSITMMDLLTKPNNGSLMRKQAERHLASENGLTEHMRNAYLVVTVLIVTTSFQALINPPGGGWQRDDNNNNNNNMTLVIMPPPPPNTTMKHSESSIRKGHQESFLGKKVTKEILFYPFLAVNSITFAVSVAMTFKLLPIHTEDTGFLYWSLVFLMATYSMSSMLISPPNIRLLFTAAWTFLGVVTIFVAFICMKVTPADFVQAKWIPVPSFSKAIRRLSTRCLLLYQMERRVCIGKYKTRAPWI